jgi:hypothetical protein
MKGNNSNRPKGAVRPVFRISLWWMDVNLVVCSHRIDLEIMNVTDGIAVGDGSSVECHAVAAGIDDLRFP